jgi:hypothetical protein
MSKLDPDKLLYEATKERALLYLEFFREIQERHGVEEAIEVLSSAIKRRGEEFGQTLNKFAPKDFEGLCEEFSYAPDGGKLFSPQVIRCDDEGFEVKMRRCPLKDAWLDAGVTEKELLTLLSCASSIDVGTMEAAGFDLEVSLAGSDQPGCCYLKVSKKP